MNWFGFKWRGNPVVPNGLGFTSGKLVVLERMKCLKGIHACSMAGNAASVRKRDELPCDPCDVKIRSGRGVHQVAPFCCKAFGWEDILPSILVAGGV